MSTGTFPAGEGFPVFEAARELAGQAWDIAKEGLQTVIANLRIEQNDASVTDMGIMYSGGNTPPAPEPLPKRDPDANRDKIKDAEPGAKASDPKPSDPSK